MDTRQVIRKLLVEAEEAPSPSMTPERAYEWARQDQGNSATTLKAKDLDWDYYPAYPVKWMLHLKSIRGANWSPESWAQWYADEKQMGVDEEQPDRYKWIEPPNVITDPVVFAALRDDVIDIWDGNHRVGAAAAFNLPTLPVLVGTPKEGVEYRMWGE